MKIKNFVSTVAVFAGMVGSTMMATGSSVAVGAIGYTAVAVATTSVGLADAEARRSSSRSSFSRSSSSSSRSSYTSPKPTNPTPSVGSNSSRGKAAASAPVTAKPATPAPTTSSMIGSNVSKPAAATNTRAARATPTRYSSAPPVNRTWNTSPAQRASNGSVIQPLLIGAAAGIGGAMLYDWITSPSSSTTTTTTTTNAAATADSANSATEGGLQVVKPNATFKKFEGSEIPEKYQEVMKKQGLTIEPKQGEVTEYSKKIKMKDGVEITVDVAELPVLVVYVNEAGKPSEALFMPI